MPQEDHVATPVWDLPVRLFHWALLLLFSFQLVTGAIGGEMMAAHMYSGYGVLGLVAFRVYWGFAGSATARFRNFVKGPAATLRFIPRLFSRQPLDYTGHNPVGGWMVVAMLASFALQAGTGLFANDGVATEGPLASLVSLDASNRLAQVHRWNVNVLMVLAGLHVLAVLYHWLVRGESLIGTMLTGVRRVSTQPPDEEDDPVPTARNAGVAVETPPRPPL